MVAESIASIKPADLPAPPQAALQIMRACSREDFSNKELAELAATDPVLTAELLRVVNSPFFGLSREVQSINYAVNIIGQRALRNLALCIAVRDTLREQDLGGLDTTTYWEDSLRRAVSARQLGKQAGLDVDDCFTAGLLQDFGLLVMFYLYPELAADWPALRRLDPDNRFAREEELFGITHDKVVTALAKAWSLPAELMEALGTHHQCQGVPANDQADICHILHCADWLCAIFSADDKARVLAHCHRVMQEGFGFETAQADAFFAEIPQQVESAAVALGLHIKLQTDFDQILRDANLRLAEENRSYQELTWQLEKAVRERDKYAAALNAELELAREIQQSLLPRQQPASFPLSGINISAKQLSGDFYDYFLLPDGRIYFNLADVSGKGMNAALLMAKTSSLFRCLGKKIHNPAELLSLLNAEICETSIRGMFVTMTAGIYHPATETVELINAGNLPAVLLHADGNVQTIKAQAPPLGIVPDCEFPLVKLGVKDCSLYLYTDGVTEGHVASGEELGIKGFLKMLWELRQQPPAERLQSIVSRFQTTSMPLRDDITILLIESRHGRNTKVD